ncbi:tRNA (adenosine(37)-N6)-threonylcarbamoyltransferase complex ATPase subunit type 1 TsaE [Bacillus kwashiorkori]|uniref:tRNA (adenosine(37)-N6)-threonylcarbamoyltransferase complex ATPase subunit type 1 TsaE n=1 Tax=Bacillus kwashiorkori TaxID=1522318 RepID=UPI00078048B2|nr:tRNA (adenosine(37)-N6)-threonylcarbamoyltransferase complex ATPase subunit type 1 TsaE [Bacillus kwashiorkori]
MTKIEWIVKSEDETKKVANKLGALLEAGDVIALEGDLGAGKTTFTKGIASSLGIRKTVNSPTFTIIKEYHGELPLYHLDVYRLEDSMEDLGFDDYFHGDGVTVIEWAHLIKDQLPAQILTIYIYHISESSRKLVFMPVGERYNQLCKELLDENISN